MVLLKMLVLLLGECIPLVRPSQVIPNFVDGVGHCSERNPLRRHPRIIVQCRFVVAQLETASTVDLKVFLVSRRHLGVVEIVENDPGAIQQPVLFLAHQIRPLKADLTVAFR